METPEVSKPEAPKQDARIIKWSDIEWHQLETALRPELEKLFREGHRLSTRTQDVLDLIDTLQSSIFPPERWRKSTSIAASTRMERLLKELAKQILPATAGKTPLKRLHLTEQERENLAAKYLELWAQNPAMNQYDIADLAQREIFPEEKWRSKHTRYHSIRGTIQILLQRQRQTAPTVEERPPEPVAAQAVESFDWVRLESLIDSKLQATISTFLEGLRSTSDDAEHDIEATLSNHGKRLRTIYRELGGLSTTLNSLVSRSEALGRQIGATIALGHDVVAILEGGERRPVYGVVPKRNHLIKVLADGVATLREELDGARDDIDMLFESLDVEEPGEDEPSPGSTTANASSDDDDEDWDEE